MPRAPKRCSSTCNKKVVRGGKCEEHQPPRIPWVKNESSPDRSYLKTGEWQRQRSRVLFRDNNGYNSSGIIGCQGRYVSECEGEAREVDHIAPVWYRGVDEVDDTELQGLCTPCHRFKTSRDGYFAKMKKQGKI